MCTTSSWRSQLRSALLAIFVTACLSPRSAGAAGCPSDCSGDRRVSIDELIRCVGVVLGQNPLSVCPSCDSDENGSVAINDLVRGVSASLGALRLVANGICWQPGPEGVIACAPGTRVRMLRCDDLEICLDGSDEGVTEVSDVEITSDGAWAAELDGCEVASAAIIMVADVTAVDDYRVIDVGSGETVSPGLIAGGPPRPPLTDLRISPDSEAATRLIADEGLEGFDDARLESLFAAVEAASDDAEFAGLSPADAVELSLDVAAEDPAVQAILGSTPATPTATPTSTPTLTTMPMLTATATLTASATPTATATLTATPLPGAQWIGGNGLWSDPANWSGGATPGLDDDVRITAAGAPTITHDAGDTHVRSLVVENGLVVSGGSITVHGDSQISGPLTCSSALAADGAGVELQIAGAADIDGCSLEASSGATLLLPDVTSFSADPDTVGRQPQWRATGSGSLLRLLNLAEAAGVSLGGASRFSVSAIAGGNVDLPALASITSGRVGFSAEAADSRFDLPQLVGVPSGSTLVATDGGQLAVPLFTQLDGVTVSIRGAASLMLTQLTAFTRGDLTVAQAAADFSAMTSMDGTSLSALQGATIALPAVLEYSADPDSAGRQPRWTAIGNGSGITLANLTNLNGVSVGGASRLSMIAEAGGTIALAALSTIDTGRVALSAAGAGSLIDLPLLSNLPDGGEISAAAGGAISLPEIFQLDGITMTLTGAGTLPIGQLAQFTRGGITLDAASASFTSLEEIDGTSLRAHNGGSIMLPAVFGYAADPDMSGRQPLWEAADANSVVELPSLTSLSGVSVGGASRLTVQALRAGRVTLDHLEFISGGRVRFVAQDADSLVDLSGLLNFNATDVTFESSNGGTIDLP